MNFYYKMEPIKTNSGHFNLDNSSISTSDTKPSHTTNEPDLCQYLDVLLSKVNKILSQLNELKVKNNTELNLLKYCTLLLKTYKNYHN